MKSKNFSGGHLTRTQKAAGPSEESIRNHREWIVKYKLIRILELIGGLYSTCFRFMVYIPPISKKLSLTNMALMASKTFNLLFSRLALLLLYYLLFFSSILDRVARDS